MTTRKPVRNNPKSSPRGTIRHRRTGDNSEVLYKILETMQRDLDIVVYEREQDNKVIYDLSCQLSNTNIALDARLKRIELDLQAMFSRFWAVVVTAMGAVASAIAVAALLRR
ncbi:MAG: hypothetical protein HC916_07845 [Coleofasciculaceae cyanobacterium SM2_1_6]|nr:hypothetical protein [Coleofasciculaceae cyanobacterium SM2_1_6]